MIIFILTVQLNSEQSGEVLSLSIQVKCPGDVQVLLVQTARQVANTLPADVLQGLAGSDHAALHLLPQLVEAVEELGGDGVAALLEQLLALHLLPI